MALQVVGTMSSTESNVKWACEEESFHVADGTRTVRWNGMLAVRENEEELRLFASQVGVTIIIGHYNPSVRIIELVSYTT